MRIVSLCITSVNFFNIGQFSNVSSFRLKTDSMASKPSKKTLLSILNTGIVPILLTASQLSQRKIPIHINNYLNFGVFSIVSTSDHYPTRVNRIILKGCCFRNVRYDNVLFVRVLLYNNHDIQNIKMRYLKIFTCIPQILICAVCSTINIQTSCEYQFR